MSKEQQPEALRLAEFFDSMQKSSHRWYDGQPVHEKAASELRRLHAENAALKRELIKESARTAAEKRRADLMSLQHSMQAALNRDAREQLAHYAASEIAALANIAEHGNV